MIVVKLTEKHDNKHEINSKTYIHKHTYTHIRTHTQAVVVMVVVVGSSAASGESDSSNVYFSYHFIFIFPSVSGSVNDIHGSGFGRVDSHLVLDTQRHGAQNRQQKHWQR